MDQVPGLGVIGGGIWARHHMNAVRDLEREGLARLVAMAARTDQTVSKVSEEFGIDGTTNWRELLERDDIDAISIVTPDHLHREMTIEALRAGKQVIVEKPMDLTTEGCEEMVRVAREEEALLFVDFHKRYDKVYQKSRQLIQSGALGSIQYGYTYMEDKIVVPRDWFSSWADKTDPFWFIGVHQVDMLRWVLGSEVRRVTAHGFKGKLSSLGIDTYDSVHAQLEFVNGAVIPVSISWILPENFEAVVNQGTRFVGTEGILEMDTQDRGFKGCTGNSSTQTYNINSAHVSVAADGEEVHSGYFVEPIKDFMRLAGHIRRGRSALEFEGQYPGGPDGLEATRVALAVHEALEQKREITIERKF
ncbi:MAG: Gfo/Idh/MocA family oxidoreductase [Balneolaceae bacterium]